MVFGWGQVCGVEICTYSGPSRCLPTVCKKLHTECLYIYIYFFFPPLGFAHALRCNQKASHAVLGNLEHSSCVHRCFDRTHQASASKLTLISTSPKSLLTDGDPKACCLALTTNFYKVAANDLDMIAFYLRAVLWDVMPCVCSHELDWVGGLEPQDPLREEKFEKTGGWVARLMERPLFFMRETGAPGLPLEPSKDVASCFGRRGYLPRSRCSSGDCAGGRVGEGCLRCFICRYFGSVDGSVEHRPTCIGAVPGLWFHYTIPALWLGQVSKCRVWSGPHKAAVSKTGFALCSGRPSRGCREPPVFAFPWWPSIPTDIFETFSESLERAHRHLTCHSLFANPCVAGEGVELVGLGRFGT